MEDSEVLTAAVEVASTAVTAAGITAGMVVDTTVGHPIVPLMSVDQERCTVVRPMACMEALHRHEAPRDHRRVEASLTIQAEVLAGPLQPHTRQTHTVRLPMDSGTPSPTVTRPAAAWAALLHRRAAPAALRLTWEPALTERRRATWPQPATQRSPMGSGTPWVIPTLPPDRPGRRHRRRLTLRLTQPWPRTRMQC